MAEIIVMPKMNLTMEEGTLAKWYKQPGDTVELEEPICSIENEKETVDMESPAQGVLVKLWGAEMEKYTVGTPIALVAQPGEDVQGLIDSVEQQNSAPAVKQVEAQPQPEKPVPQSSDSGEVANLKMLPKVRKYAKQKNVDLAQLAAFCGDKKITEQDIDVFLQHSITGERVKLSGMRKAIMRNMAESCQKTARLTNFMEVDLTELMAKLAQLKSTGEKISVTAAVIKACAIALKEHKIVNSRLDEQKEEILLADTVNIGCAVDIPEGLVVPVIRGADGLSCGQIAQAVRELGQAAAEGTLSAQQMSGGTFTVTNVGMLGVESFTPIINYPQTAILGVGAVQTLPRYLNGDETQLHPRKIMKIGITYDHRVIDGAPASRFLQRVRRLLEECDVL